jgi:hypothetical protein
VSSYKTEDKNLEGIFSYARPVHSPNIIIIIIIGKTALYET